MSDTLSETVACDLLARLFRSRGYAIERNVPFREYGVEFHIDGWDPRARVGFEFLSSEDDDHDDLSLAEYQTLSTAQQRGELSLFILDEVEPLSAAELTAAARDFLDEAADAARAKSRACKKTPGGSRDGGRTQARGQESCCQKKHGQKNHRPKNNGPKARCQKTGAEEALAREAAGRDRAQEEAGHCKGRPQKPSLNRARGDRPRLSWPATAADSGRFGRDLPAAATPPQSAPRTRRAAATAAACGCGIEPGRPPASAIRGRV